MHSGPPVYIYICLYKAGHPITFNKVQHKRHGKIKKNYTTRGNILGWVCMFLKWRQPQVIVHGVNSEWKENLQYVEDEHLKTNTKKKLGVIIDNEIKFTTHQARKLMVWQLGWLEEAPQLWMRQCLGLCLCNHTLTIVTWYGTHTRKGRRRRMLKQHRG